MKKFVPLIALLVIGCATTPDEVILGQEMANQTSLISERNTMNSIDALVELARAAEERRYRDLLKRDIKTLQAFSPDPNLVDARELTRLQDAYETEINKSNEYHAALGLTIKTRLAFQFAVERNLDELTLAYNKATGIDPQTFDQLLAGISSLTSQYLEQRAISEAEKDQVPKFDDIFKVFGSKWYDYGMQRAEAFDPDAAMKTWKEKYSSFQIPDEILNNLPTNIRNMLEGFK